MEASEPTPAKIRFGRWLWLASVVTVLLAAVVFWQSRRERLLYVEPIWSDSLPGHEGQTEHLGERRKIGEVWSLSRAGGFGLRDFGLRRNFNVLYPVFTSSNTFHRLISNRLLAEARDESPFAEVEFSEWCEGIKKLNRENDSGMSVSFELLFFSDNAVSLQQVISGHEGHAARRYGAIRRNFVAVDHNAHEVQLDELFHGSSWPSLIANICQAAFRKQGISFIGDPADEAFRTRILRNCLTQRGFALLPTGLRCFFAPCWFQPNTGKEVEVFVPYKKMEDHLKLDGPHRLFQARGTE